MLLTEIFNIDDYVDINNDIYDIYCGANKIAYYAKINKAFGLDRAG